ncbi:hypothetical protein SDC9_118882 [bioreactor metagenome]|uniref:Uncharacterized protein n=1 Tax=bioreactor metagenome TaxID=1076179 RepID=A0A645C4L7_9ZZZZ
MAGIRNEQDVPHLPIFQKAPQPWHGNRAPGIYHPRIVAGQIGFLSPGKTVPGPIDGQQIPFPHLRYDTFESLHYFSPFRLPVGKKPDPPSRPVELLVKQLRHGNSIPVGERQSGKTAVWITVFGNADHQRPVTFYLLTGNRLPTFMKCFFQYSPIAADDIDNTVQQSKGNGLLILSRVRNRI